MPDLTDEQLAEINARLAFDDERGVTHPHAETVRRLLSEVRRLRAEREWRSMDSAPNDLSDILLCHRWNRATRAEICVAEAGEACFVTPHADIPREAAMTAPDDLEKLAEAWVDAKSSVSFAAGSRSANPSLDPDGRIVEMAIDELREARIAFLAAARQQAARIAELEKENAALRRAGQGRRP